MLLGIKVIHCNDQTIKHSYYRHDVTLNKKGRISVFALRATNNYSFSIESLSDKEL